uniref:Uncharacterized protein n=1 Tax=Arundo donax TaxID=35708 RepID=A0A0A9B8H3_ARUDO
MLVLHFGLLLSRIVYSQST